MNASRTPGCYAPSYELVLNEYYYRRPMPIAWLLYHIASTRFGATSTTICQSDAAACHAPRGASAAITRAAAEDCVLQARGARLLLVEAAPTATTRTARTV